MGLRIWKGTSRGLRELAYGFDVAVVSDLSAKVLRNPREVKDLSARVSRNPREVGWEVWLNSNAEGE